MSASVGFEFTYWTSTCIKDELWSTRVMEPVKNTLALVSVPGPLLAVKPAAAHQIIEM